MLNAIGRCGVRYLTELGDEFRGHWSAFPAAFSLNDRDPAGRVMA